MLIAPHAFVRTRGMLVVGSLLTGCVSAGQNPDDQLAAFNDQFNNGRSDGGIGAITEPCSQVSLLRQFGQDVKKAGFFIGYSSEVHGGIVGTNSGQDIVWDIYHQQLTVSQYSTVSVRTPGLGGGVSAYAGVAFGFEHGVSDWDGYFQTYEAEIGLPFLEDFLTVQPAVFHSGVDRNHDGIIGPSEWLVPPQGVYGFSVGAELGASVPTGIPFEGAVAQGEWLPHKKAIRTIYDLLSDIRIGFIDPLDVRLVDHHSGAACDEDWPAAEPNRDCIVQFGYEGEGRFGASIDMAFGICALTGGCVAPLALPMSVASIAIGSSDSTEPCE